MEKTGTTTTVVFVFVSPVWVLCSGVRGHKVCQRICLSLEATKGCIKHSSIPQKWLNRGHMWHWLWVTPGRLLIWIHVELASAPCGFSLIQQPQNVPMRCLWAWIWVCICSVCLCSYYDGLVVSSVCVLLLPVLSWEWLKGPATQNLVRQCKSTFIIQNELICVIREKNSKGNVVFSCCFDNPLPFWSI